ncbi:uncharacterized protein PAC_04712 [Phialocephala subalpina]|uniref:Major facilitator superfamily (MFS) profile domain-containing protein n=1 Tax=Phialocephala subalpina TaxID=576137 RepID=A0A1L7WPY2_9HELO|nr:uncharacterized protein PAC_04712 [Phialocephala subalpina]
MGASTFHGLRVPVWGESTGTAAERKKTDFFILIFCCVSCSFDYLDRAAINNAYVSGMKEEANLGGNDITLLSTILTIDYIIGQVPHALAIHIVSPSIWFPSMIIVWSGLTMCMAACKNFTQLATCRKRIGLFSDCGQAGTMFAGIMMTAICRGMDGLSGLAGRKWVFIIDGLITLPIAVFGVSLLPRSTRNDESFIFTEERALAVSRLPPETDKGHKMKTAGYTVKHNNQYPLGIQGAAIVSTITYAMALDASRKRLS